MHQQIRKHLPPEAKPEEFEQSWNNATYLLEPLLAAIREAASTPKIKREDFGSPAFVEKLIFDQARYDLVQQIISYFPKKMLDKQI